MVYQLTADEVDALEQSNNPRILAQAFYGDTLKLDDVPLAPSGSLNFQGAANVQCSGSAFLAADGASYVPEAKDDALAPYGQELKLWRIVEGNGLTVQVPMGIMRITDVPETDQFNRPSFDIMGWSARLDLKDRFDIIQNDDFTSLAQPQAGAYTWAEFKALSPIPVVQSLLPDATLPAGLTYSSFQSAFTQLASNIGGVPHLTRQGELTIRQANKYLTATVEEFVVNGTVAVSAGMSNKLYNCVVVTCPSDAKIFGFAQIDDDTDPLNVHGPLGRRVYKSANPLMNSQAKADAAAATMLARLSTEQARTVTVTCLPRPDLELGDYGRVIDERTGKAYVGEIASMMMPFDPYALMTFELTVAETR